MYGIIGLVVIYCDYINKDSGPVPLLPWLHSKKTCEHVFGQLHMLVKDFCYLDFLYAVPKLGVLLKVALMQHSADYWARAEGYAHTWFDTNSLV